MKKFETVLAEPCASWLVEQGGNSGIDSVDTQPEDTPLHRLHRALSSSLPGRAKDLQVQFYRIKSLHRAFIEYCKNEHLSDLISVPVFAVLREWLEYFSLEKQLNHSIQFWDLKCDCMTYSRVRHKRRSRLVWSLHPCRLACLSLRGG